MDIKNKKISEGDFHALRKEILTQWPTGKDVDLQEAIDYHKAMPEADAIAELKRCSGTQFDPDVVEAFVRLLEREELPKEQMTEAAANA